MDGNCTIFTISCLEVREGSMDPSFLNEGIKNGIFMYKKDRKNNANINIYDNHQRFKQVIALDFSVAKFTIAQCYFLRYFIHATFQKVNSRQIYFF